MFAPGKFRYFLLFINFCLFTYELVVMPGMMLNTYLMYALTGAFSITMMHRVFCHNAIQTWTWVKRLSTITACATNVGTPITWAGVHTLHHMFSDTPDDPHSPKVYPWWRICLGYFDSESIAKNIGKAKRRIVEVSRDKFVVFVHRYYYLVFAAMGLATIAIFGFDNAVVYYFSPAFIASLMTYVINVVSHTWMGYSNFDIGDGSKNTLFTYPLFLGENYHNNHHKYPGAAHFKVKWWEVDPMYFWMVVLDKTRYTK